MCVFNYTGGTRFINEEAYTEPSPDCPARNPPDNCKDCVFWITNEEQGKEE